METKIFDKETILDLMVNFIPLGIILFFIGAFVVFAPWGFDPMASGLMLAIMGGMFIALTVLTYYSAKAIAGDEKRATVYAQGQAGLEGAVPLHGSGDDAESVADTAVDDTDADDADSVEEHDTDAEVDPETDETDLTDTDTTTDSEVTAESETVAADDDTDADSASEPSGKNESTE